MRTFLGQEVELLGVNFKTLALFHEHDKLDEGGLVDVVIFLHYEISHHRTQSDGVNVVDAHHHYLINQDGAHIGWVFNFVDVCHQLLKMLLLLTDHQSLEQTLVYV